MTELALPLGAYETGEYTSADRAVNQATERGWAILPPFALPVVASAMSWMMGGIPMLTDFAMVALTVLCFVFCVLELREFNRRAGIGGLLLFGGVLIWFCHDYLSNWFGVDFGDPNVYFSASVVAKTAFLHCIFVFCMVIGLLIRRGAWVEKAITFAPEPGRGGVYITAMLVLCAAGMSTYFLFTRENGFISMAKGALPYWLGEPEFTVFRSGNLNYSWGAYVAQIMQLGEFSALLACFYGIMLGRGFGIRLLCVFIWTFWTLVAFASGRRGNVVALTLPPMALWFIKYQMESAEKAHRYSAKAYLLGGGMLLFTLTFTQIQGTFRGEGLATTNLSQLHLTKSQGNTMFSEGLVGYATIPEAKNFFYDTFPGETIIRPIPQTLYWFLIDPIPRALWNTKPIDPVWTWYNASYLGSGTGTEGTTISQGMVGWWYFRFGLSGVIQGGILFGLGMGICERALRFRARDPIKILSSLGFAVFLFRSYRDLNFHFLYSLLIGMVGLTLVTPVLKLFSSPRPNE